MSKIKIEVTVATAAFTLLVACDPNSQPTDPTTLTTDSAGIRIVHSQPMNSDATCAVSEEPAVVIGDDESDENQWFSRVGNVARMSDGSIVAVDRGSAQIRIYDPDGQHLRTMGRQGEGPGEFENGPFQMWIAAGDTIWAGDYFPGATTSSARKGNSCGGCVSPRSSSTRRVLEACWTTATP